MLTYQETVSWMFQQLPMYQQLGKKAYRADLSNITKLVAHLENPHHNLKMIHVAGTNGKGSVSHMLASVLQESGYKVGLYTSPHLKDFKERIRVNGQGISEEAVIEFIGRNRNFLEQENYSFFEMTVGMAFDYFAREETDIAVIEVGLGGRLDSTNIIDPVLAVITNIGFDHVGILGHSLPEIAREKAGIIKKGRPVVVGEILPETLPVFQEVAAARGARLYLAPQDSLLPDSDLKGYYQDRNKATALKAIEVLIDQGWNIPSEAVAKGFLHVRENTGLRGRWDVLQEKPRVIGDTAHNAEGLEYVLRQLYDQEYKQLYIVLGVVSDKDLDAILPLFPKEACYFFCKPAVPRGLQEEVLQEKASQYGLRGKIFPSVQKALEAALNVAEEDDLIYVGGSTFTVAEII